MTWEKNLGGLGFGNEFLDTTPEVYVKKKKIDKFEFIKIKNLCFVKGAVKIIKIQATDWEKVFSKHISDKELVPKIYEELLKPNNKQTNNSTQK